MKKISSLILILLLSTFVIFASAAKEDNSSSTLKTVVAGKLTVATSPDFAPCEFYAISSDGKPELAGFDIYLAQYIADYLGLKLDIIPMDFDGTLMELAMKNVDLSMAGYSPDPEREDSMDFSDIYYSSSQSFVTSKSKASKFQTLESLNDPSITVAAQTGSIQMDLANEYSAKADIIGLTKVTDIIAEVVAGKLDGAYIETPVAETYAKNYPDLAITVEVPYDESGFAVGVSKGNTALLEGVNAAIAQALADGSMANFVTKASELAEGNIYQGLLEDK